MLLASTVVGIISCLLSAPLLGDTLSPPPTLSAVPNWKKLATHNPFLNNTVVKHATYQLIQIPVSYIKSESIVKLLQGKPFGLLSAKGHIRADPAANTLWIYDDKSHLSKIRHWLKTVDCPQRQILIKTRIVNIDNDDLQALGVLFKSVDVMRLSQSPRLNSRVGSFSLPIAKLGAGAILDIELTALTKQGEAKIISSPEVVTLNNQTATIESGDEIPYQEKTGTGNTSVVFKKAVLRLEVTPHLLPDDRISLRLTINHDNVSSLTVHGVPAIRTQRLSTEVVVDNKATLALGGIFDQTQSKQQQGVPVLSRIPILGFLFREHESRQQRKKLLVFITPVLLGK